ncbi:MAG: AGE family epimerase/isomerase [Candidatus Latescibacteria bacterium]|nr:AGE family epimerase/isomerase [Candidatus Latescibacterota bacterium]
MRRRHFITNMMQGLALSAAPSAWAMGEDRDGNDYGAAKLSPTVVDKIGSHTIRELRDFHQRELDEEYLPVWEKHGIDWEYGGFMPYWDKDGNYTTTNKEMYYMGRGIWVFSYLYNNFGGNPKHLEAARLCIDFILKYCRDENGYWISEVTREGKLVQGSTNIYGDMYVVLGLGEYFKATGEKKWADLAIESGHDVNERMVSPNYQHLAGHGRGHEPGTKRLGTWQHFLSTLTPLARYTKDYGVEMIARMCVRNIMERHYDPEFGLMFERLDDKFQPFRYNPIINNRVVSGWHSIQASWMCMDEALRLGQRRMFSEAMEMGRYTLERCWVDGEKGGLVSLSDPTGKPVEPGNYAPSGAMDDALIFTLLSIEHTHAPWAIYWFDKVFEHGYKKPDRWKRTCLLHHPRRLFSCIQMLDRMIARGGRVSDFLEG